MIIEMTYGEWRKIYESLGKIPTADLPDGHMLTALELRSRIISYAFDN